MTNENQIMTIDEIYEAINEGFGTGQFTHKDVLDMFKNFIDDTLMLKVEFGLKPSQVKILEIAAFALDKASSIKVD